MMPPSPMPSGVDVDRVASLLAEVVADEVLPHFRALPADAVEAKVTPGDPEDLVSTVDRAVERRLAAGLGGLLPGSTVVGEEAVCDEPGLLDALRCDGWVWLVDPIDGTKSFVRGEETFGVMVALARGGKTRAAWIALPARGELFVAEEGAGAFLDGVRLWVPPRTASTPGGARPPRGTFYVRFMPPASAAALERAAAGRHGRLPGTGVAAIEYTSVLQGEKDFVVYHRLLPWDHAPGALLLTEAGGRVEHLDGRAYVPTAADRITIVPATPAIGADVRGWLAGQELERR